MVRSRPITTAVEQAHIPAPVGINRVDPAASLPITDCLALVNLVASQYGLQTRSGWQEWVTGMTGTSDSTVRTIIPYHGSTSSSDELFATTDTKIYNVTASGTSPATELTFALPGALAGWGVFHKVTVPGGHYLLYTDERNGLHVFSQSAGTWSVGVAGVGASEFDTSAADVAAGRTFTPANMVAVTVFNNRVWMVERDTTRAWYSGVNSIFGQYTSFDFGLKLKLGGPIINLYNWSYDGGSGMDTLLVGFSSSGDVIIYQGTDPSSASTFGLKGVWTTGGLPIGRNVANDFGGELMVLAKTGLLPLSRLVVGGSAEDQQLYHTRKIGPYWERLAELYSDYRGWATHIHPRDNALIVLVPTTATGPTEQIAMALDTKGWSFYRDLPIMSAGVFEREMYFGTEDGRIGRMNRDVDDMDITDPESYTPMDWSILTRYTNLGNSRNKQIQSIRPVLLAGQQDVSMTCSALYDFSLAEPSAPSGAGGGGAAAWGVGVWDTAVWGDEYAAGLDVFGATGMGRYVAVAIRGKSYARATLVGIDVTYNQGGVLG